MIDHQLPEAAFRPAPPVSHEAARLDDLRVQVGTRRLALFEARLAATLAPNDPDVGAVLDAADRIFAAALGRLRRAEEREP